MRGLVFATIVCVLSSCATTDPPKTSGTFFAEITGLYDMPVYGSGVLLGTKRKINFSTIKYGLCHGEWQYREVDVPLKCTRGIQAEMHISSHYTAAIKFSDGATASMLVWDPEEGRPAQTPTVYVPPSDYCRNSNYYGAISCQTWRPKTNYVNGYFRKNGTYVKPYWRS